MSYLKFKADKLFDGYHFSNEDAVLVSEEDGTIEDIVLLKDAGDDIQYFSGILSPGFINCHCHLELSHMKNMVNQGTGLVKFVQDVIEQRHYPEEIIKDAIEKAEEEMLVNGIVAVGDICNNTLTIQQKEKGRIKYHNFIEVSGFNPAIAAQRFQQSLDFFKQYLNTFSNNTNSLVPHAPYSVSDELWKLIINHPGNNLLTIHNQESEAETELFLDKTGAFLDLYQHMQIDISFFNPTGKSSLQTYLPKLLPHQSIILVHNVHTTKEDILLGKQTTTNGQLHYCLCPNANQYISNKLPDVDLLIKHDCNIVLGTDSLASNLQLNILEEIKTIKNYFPQIGPETLLRWATSNGAKALQMDTTLGSFEKGKKPGIDLIDENFNVAKKLT